MVGLGCIAAKARQPRIAVAEGVDVVVDYVVEDGYQTKRFQKRSKQEVQLPRSAKQNQARNRRTR